MKQNKDSITPLLDESLKNKMIWDRNIDNDKVNYPKLSRLKQLGFTEAKDNLIPYSPVTLTKWDEIINKIKESMSDNELESTRISGRTLGRIRGNFKEHSKIAYDIDIIDEELKGNKSGIKSVKLEQGSLRIDYIVDKINRSKFKMLIKKLFKL